METQRLLAAEQRQRDLNAANSEAQRQRGADNAKLEQPLHIKMELGRRIDEVRDSSKAATDSLVRVLSLSCVVSAPSAPKRADGRRCAR